MEMKLELADSSGGAADSQGLYCFVSLRHHHVDPAALDLWLVHMLLGAAGGVDPQWTCLINWLLFCRKGGERAQALTQAEDEGISSGWEC